MARGRGRGRGRGRAPTVTSPPSEAVKLPIRTGQKEAVLSYRNQMPDIDKRRQAAKRTNEKPLAHNEISDANRHRQPPDPHIYRDVLPPVQVVGQHRNGSQSIAYPKPSTYMPKGRGSG